MMAWLRRLVRGRQLERHLDAELRDHIERQVADHVRTGMTETEARRQALMAIGGLEQVKEQCRNARGTIWLDQIGRDVMYAIRQVRRQPGFWSVIMLTLVLGIATSTTIFAIVNGVLLRSLPYPEADRLVNLAGLSYKGEFFELHQRSQTMDIGGFQATGPVSLTGSGEPVRLDAARATAELFDVLGVNTLLGRRFGADDTKPGAPPVLVLGYGLWQQRFGGEAATIGKQLTIDGVGHTVIGVMPASFRFPSGAQFWLPLVIDPGNRINLWSTNARMVGRLRAGVQPEQAREEVRALAPSFREFFPWRMPAEYGRRATVIPLHEQIVGDVRPTLLVLLGSVVTVLFILSVNVANLLLTRGLSRGRELAIRVALGATRVRLVRQLLIESLTIALLAGILGTAGAFALIELTIPLLPTDVPRVDEIGIDGRVLAFALAVSMLTGLLFGILPAIRASSASGDRSPLRAGSTRLHAPERRLARLLATAEFALAVMLVVTAALLVKSFWNLMAVEPGFRVEQLVTATVAPPQFRYGRPESRRQFAEDLVARLRAVPGVRSAAAGSAVPFGGAAFGSVFRIEGRPDPSMETGEWPGADVRTVITTEYLRVLGVPILEGRAFADADGPDAPRVALVSRSLARKYWGTTSPVGTRIRSAGDAAPWVTIVGVVGDLKWNNLGDERSSFTDATTAGWLGTLYLPLAQTDSAVIRVVLRTERDSQQIAASLRGIVQSLDRDTPVSDIRTSEALIAESAARPRFTAFLLAMFAAVALFLGAIGVYGVLAYAVSRRTQEFAIRLAIGGSTRDILRGVIGEGMKLTLVGIAFGLVGAVVLTRALSRLLFGVEPADPGIFAGVTLLLIVIGFLASYVPARRAMRVDLLAALRMD